MQLPIAEREKENCDPILLAIARSFIIYRG